ncbi:MAG: HAD family hydrolase [Chloroflexota bacterium]|nr:MAG: haloacid dehalogenase [Chloroflexota bacterium]
MSQSAPIRGVIFDFDGLILDTEVPAFTSWQEVYREHGCTLTIEMWSRVLGGSGIEWDHVAYLESETGRTLNREEIHRQRLIRKVELIEAESLLPGVLDRIDEGQVMGLALAVVSSSPHSWVDAYLYEYELRDRFIAVVCGEDAPRSKPHPDLYQVALARMRLLSSETLAFEDSPNGITAAQGAGIFCVVVPNAISRQLPIDHADLCLSSLAQMPLEALLRTAQDVWSGGVASV